MFWYLIICVLMLYPWMLDYGGRANGKKTECLALGAACLILWFFVAFRSENTGVDTKFYCYAFTQFEQIPFHRIFTETIYGAEGKTWAFNFEPGYRLLNKLFSLFGSQPQIITVVNSTIIMALLYRIIRNQSPMRLLSVWLYITLGVYQTEMNVTRNAIAILIVYNAVYFVEHRQVWKYVLCCALGAAFHISALAFIPIYWIYHFVRLTPGRCVALVSAFICIGLFFPLFAGYIQEIVPDRYVKYLAEDQPSLSKMLVGGLNAVVFLLCYAMLEPSERQKIYTEQKFGVIMFVLNMSFFGLNLGFNMAARLAALSGPYMMILAPQMLRRVRPERQRLAVLAVVLLCGVQYVLRMCINNIGGSMPYQFFFQ